MQIRPRMALIAGTASIVTVTFLILIKLYAVLQTGSVSVMASLVDSVLDASISIVTLLAIRISLKPADDDHRHGHGKVEGLAALFQAAFIMGGGFFLLLESAGRFQNASLSENAPVAIIIMIISIILSAILVAIQNYSLRYAPSLAVEADRAHYSSDIVINLGVIGVLAALQYGAPVWIDPLFAMAVALYLGFTVYKIARQGIDMLLDRELSGDARETITRRVLAHEGVKGMHDLRTSKSGMKVFISFDVELDPGLYLYDAHEILREIEFEVLMDFPNAEILIHADPHGDTYDTRHNAPAEQKNKTGTF